MIDLLGDGGPLLIAAVEEEAWKSLFRSFSWGSVRGSVVGNWYCVFCGVSPVGTYSLSGALAIEERRSASGCWMFDFSGGRVFCRAVLCSEMLLPISLTRS